MSDSVIFRTTPLFRQTLAKHKNMINPLKEFIMVKSKDPMEKFGSKDQHFVGGGPLSASKLIHAHLTHDISLLYKRSGRNPTVIDLYAIVTHDELGTGQPPNLKLQKTIAKKVDGQDDFELLKK